MAAPPPAIAPKMPNALARSRGLGEGRGQQRERGGREQRAERRPAAARAATSTPKLCAAPPIAEATAKPTRPTMKVALAAEEVAEAAAEQQQAAEGQGVGGDDPLAAVVGEAERLLGGRQRDVHDRRVEDDHQLGDAEDGEDGPAAGVMGICVGRHETAFWRRKVEVALKFFGRR